MPDTAHLPSISSAPNKHPPRSTPIIFGPTHTTANHHHHHKHTYSVFDGYRERPTLTTNMIRYSALTCTPVFDAPPPSPTTFLTPSSFSCPPRTHCAQASIPCPFLVPRHVPAVREASRKQRLAGWQQHHNLACDDGGTVPDERKAPEEVPSRPTLAWVPCSLSFSLSPPLRPTLPAQLTFPRSVIYADTTYVGCTGVAASAGLPSHAPTPLKERLDWTTQTPTAPPALQQRQRNHC